jgi:ABC-2 type transport system permease protein
MCAALWVALSAIDVATRIPGVDPAGLAAMSVHLWVFGLLFGAAAAAVGAGSGRRAYALGTAVGLAVVAFLANGLLAQVTQLRWTRNLSPFYWLTGGSPLENGVQTGHLLVAGALAAALVAVGLRSFERRDLAS